MAEELKKLTSKEIAHKNLNTHELWMIKKGQTVYGPFELSNLKSYIVENVEESEEFLASRMEPLAWQPIYNFVQFQRRSPQIIGESNELEGPFWLLENGLKTGPFDKFHILKRIEMNSLIVTDNISCDEGKTWLKIFEIPDFDRRDLSSEALPMAPLEQTLSQMYNSQTKKSEESPSEMIASSAHRGMNRGQVLQFKINKYALRKNSESFWDKFDLSNWLIPSAVSLSVVVLAAVAYNVLPSQFNNSMSVSEMTQNSRPLGEQRQANPSAQMNRSQRKPASIKPTKAPTLNKAVPAIKRFEAPSVPTTIRTHQVDRYPTNTDSDTEFGHYEEPHTDPYDNPFDEQPVIHEAPKATNLVPPTKRSGRRTAAVSDVMGYEENAQQDESDF